MATSQRRIEDVRNRSAWFSLLQFGHLLRIRYHCCVNPSKAPRSLLFQEKSGKKLQEPGPVRNPLQAAHPCSSSPPWLNLEELVRHDGVSLPSPWAGCRGGGPPFRDVPRPSSSESLRPCLWKLKEAAEDKPQRSSDAVLFRGPTRRVVGR